MGMWIWTAQTFCRQYSKFRDGRELVEDDESGGRPKSTRTEVNIAAVADLVKKYRRIVSRILAESLNIPKIVVRPVAFCCREYFLLHDNAPAHKAANVCQFWPPKNVTTLYHPRYSPDLSPPDYFLFPKLKMKLQRPHFADVAQIQEAVTGELKKIQKGGIIGSFSETVRPRKSLYICQWSLFWRTKKAMCLFLVSLI
jgi:hypothetical protein